MIVKANIKTNPTINVNLENGYSFGSVESVLETEVVDIPLRIEWDGSDYASLEKVPNLYYYKVSDEVPTEDEIEQGGLFVGFNTSSHNTYEFNLTVTDDYIALRNSSLAPRVYKEGNSAGVSPGIYFYRSSSSYYTSALVLTGHIVNEVTKLKEHHLPEVDVIPRNYGGLYGTYYNIPNIKVDSMGRVIEASESVISEASSKSSGIMPSAMYSYIENGDHANYAKVSFAVNSEYSFTLTNFKRLYITMTDSGNVYIPVVYAVYAYLYTDASKTIKQLVPIPYKIVPNSSSTCSVKVECPEEYREFNLVDGDTDGSASYIDALVFYERTYTISSGH